MLAHVLVPGATSKESIPPSIRQYLNSPATESGLTKRESLIERWRKSGVITTNLKNERNLGKLSASANPSRKEGVQLITDRIVMLHDVKTTIESMDKQLVSALKEERKGNAPWKIDVASMYGPIFVRTNPPGRYLLRSI